MHVVSRKDLHRLEVRIETLEKELEAFRAKAAKKTARKK